MKEYKEGEIIKIKRKEEIKRLNADLTGVKSSLQFLSTLYGEVLGNIWNFIEREYPGEFKKYNLSYSNYQLKILNKRGE